MHFRHDFHTLFTLTHTYTPVHTLHMLMYSELICQAAWVIALTTSLFGEEWLAPASDISVQHAVIVWHLFYPGLTLEPDTNHGNRSSLKRTECMYSLCSEPKATWNLLSVFIQHCSPAKAQAGIRCDLLQPPAITILQDALGSNK